MRVHPNAVREVILHRSRCANVGHIGSALSVADIVACLYDGVLRVESPEALDRDRFVLSKGHASLALYAALHLRGWISEEQLAGYCSDDTLLGVHCDRELRGVDFNSGSLGQGLSVATGAALAARLQKSERRVYALLSDAELNEGSTWEAVMFASHHRLENLTAIIDVNGQQALGYTREVLDLAPLAKRWDAFGWQVSEVDGHDVDAIKNVIATKAADGKPHVVLAQTVFGKGVSFMQSQIKWHYWPMSEDEYQTALAEIGSVA